MNRHFALNSVLRQYTWTSDVSLANFKLKKNSCGIDRVVFLVAALISCLTYLSYSYDAFPAAVHLKYD